MYESGALPKKKQKTLPNRWNRQFNRQFIPIPPQVGTTLDLSNVVVSDPAFLIGDELQQWWQYSNIPNKRYEH
jgi:hypothetical protein